MKAAETIRVHSITKVVLTHYYKIVRGYPLVIVLNLFFAHKQSVLCRSLAANNKNLIAFNKMKDYIKEMQHKMIKHHFPKVHIIILL